MKIPTPLAEGRFVARYRRFFMEIRLEDGTPLTVHCANSGSMEGCLEPGARVLASEKQGGRGRLTHVAEWIRLADGWVGINTHRTNQIAGEALRQGLLPELASYRAVRAEVPYGRSSRVDFLLSGPGLPECYVEVKNATWPGPDGAIAFPDAVTERGLKHLRELTAMVRRGHRAVLLFVANRAWGDHFRACHERDPVYARALAAAAREGVELLCYRTRIHPPDVSLAGPVPVRLAGMGRG